MITLYHYLALSAVLFGLGLVGLMIRRNLLIILMCIEVLLNSANLAFVAFARYYGQMDAHVVTFFVMAVAAAEAAVGLGILLVLYRRRQTVNAADWKVMGG